MRLLKYTTIFVLSAVALASCNKDEQTEGNYPKDGAVRINTSIADPLTRTGNTTTYNGDNLALFLDYGAGDKYTASNILWNNNGGTWSSSTLMLWKNGTTPVNIYAYSPYRDGEADATGVKFSIPADQTVGVEAADLVYDYVPNFIPQEGLDENSAINITLKHSLVKLTLNISKNNEFDGTNVTVESVLLRQTAGAVKLNLQQNGAVSVHGDAQAIDVMMHSLQGDSYEAIFFPYLGQEAGAKMITVNMSNGNSYSYTVPAEGINFEAGCAYTMNLKVGKDKLNLSGVSIGSWEFEENELNGGEAED